MSSFETIKNKIDKNEELVGILGLGYVGLPLAVTFAKKGVKVLGFEKNPDKARKADKGDNYIGDVTDEDLKDVVKKKTFSATSNFSRIAECDVVIICVPTPLDKFKKPDIDDERESPALKIMDEVAKKGGEVLFHDPYINSVVTGEGRKFTNNTLTDNLYKEADCVVITTNHSDFNGDEIAGKANLVVDLRNVIEDSSDKVYKL